MFPLVASFTGAWIETRFVIIRSCRTYCRILYGCVDWNVLFNKCKAESCVASFTGAWIETMLFLRHLSVLLVASFTGAWIETYSPFILYWKSLQSHPLRVRGLKPVREKYTGLSQRRILYGCVDWNKSRIYPHRKFDESHPLRVRGLKPYITYLEIQAYVVASFTGAWIETL